MRNILEFPIKPIEIEECLNNLVEQITTEYRIGDMRPLLLKEAVKIVSASNSSWISVNDASTPTDGRKVLAGFDGQFEWFTFIAHAHSTTMGGVCAAGFAPATHWQPMPKPYTTRALTRLTHERAGVEK